MGTDESRLNANMLAWIDDFLNRITTYRLVLYYLLLLLATAVVWSALGLLQYSPLAIIYSALFLVLICWGTNKLLTRIWRAQPNTESSYITALILALIITPVSPANGAAAAESLGFLFLAAVAAMASKYILAAKRKHFFNPAAFAVAFTGLAFAQYASWWIGDSLFLFPFMLLGGLLVARKLRHFKTLELPFLAAALLALALGGSGGNALSAIWDSLFHSYLFFFAFIMLSDPATTPPTRPLRLLYGALTGLFFFPGLHVGPVYSSPELVLLAGNVFAYLVSPKGKYTLALREKKEVAAGIYDFTFTANEKVNFRPGQYMEWTLAHAHPDTRGNRRYFTLASSPTEPDLHLGVRFYDPASSFKSALRTLAPGARLVAGQLAGDFTLPRDPRVKLAFLAGGIGITPFRSMAKYLTDTGARRDAILLYSNRTPQEIAYKEVLEAAEAGAGLRTVYILTDLPPGDNSPRPANSRLGRLDAALLQREVPDYAERAFYLSGTHAMVSAFEKMLHQMGVSRRQIKTDFFPGFA